MQTSTLLAIAAAVTLGLVGTIVISEKDPRPAENVEIASTEPAPAAYVPAPLETCPAQLPAKYADHARAAGPLVVVYKSLYLVGVYDAGTLSADNGAPLCFPVAMGMKPWGAKTSEDNQSTPEGWYRTASKQDVGQTSFYRGFLLNYPNADDVARAFDRGIVDAPTERRLLADIAAGRTPSQSTKMGGDVMIHGEGAAVPDWTAGCVAMKNDHMDVFFRHVRKGEEVLVTPWTERYATAEDGSLLVTSVEPPAGRAASIVVPYDSTRFDWEPGVRFARLEWTGRGSVKIQPILASP
ncbi:MAG: L,D-transpeptidase family protein [Candidatus Uhrbacteria bacterium]